jgi:hypothetical protein
MSVIIRHPTTDTATGTSPDAAKDEATMSDEERHQRQILKNQEAIAQLNSWAEATEEEIREQKETWEFLRRALDEDRLSSRKLFP